MSYQTDLEFARGKANAWKHLQEKAANGWRPAYAEELEQYACRKRMKAEDEMQKILTEMPSEEDSEKSESDRKITLIKTGTNICVDSNLEDQDLMSALAVMISYVGGHLQDPSQISYVCGLACGDALKMLEEKGLIRSDSVQDQANPSKTKQV